MHSLTPPPTDESQKPDRPPKADPGGGKGRAVAKRSLLARLLGLFLNVLLFLAVVAIGVGAGFTYGMYLRVYDELPRVELLDNYQPSLITTVYSRDNKVLGRFFLENRVVVPLDEIPDDLKNALFAIEDSRFYEHEGIDVKGIIRAAVANLRAGHIVEGASTITQQLVRTLYLSREKKYVRKFKEALIAWQMERHLSKDQILELYLNEIYLGHGAYGVEAAARRYFGKSARALDLAECAILAGLPKAPEKYTPIRFPERAKKRQRTILNKMAHDGFITKEEALAAAQEPIQLRQAKPEADAALYFVEQVRQRVERQLGVDAVHRGGLHIYTTLDLDWQQKAEKVVRDGLRAYDKRHEYRGALKPGASLVDLASEILEGARLMAQVVKTSSKGVRVEVLTRTDGKRPDLDFESPKLERTAGRIPAKALEWTKKKARELFQPGDLILVRAEKIPKKGELVLSLEQEPEVEGALVCLDPFSGEVLAMVGGYNFEKSEFNRAIQAKRQPGSAFKEIIYLTALEKQLTPATIVYDTAVVEEMEDSTEEDPKLWRPKNYTGKFTGTRTLRVALEKSLNPVAVKLVRRVGVDSVIRTARRLGITADLTPNLSLGLGSSGVSVMEMTAAYGVMAAGGLYAKPYFIRQIEDSEGRVLDMQTPQIYQAVEPEIAYVLTRLLEGVIRNGTGVRARVLKRPLAGKTGTTNEFRDAWFLGYSPRIATGVWVGFDDMQRSLGKGEAGSKAALPIWIEFMGNVLKGSEPEPFPVPEGVVKALIDPESGYLATPDCQKIIRETFVAGTVPTRHCDRHRVSIDNFELLDTGYSEEPPPELPKSAPGQRVILDPSDIPAKDEAPVSDGH